MYICVHICLCVHALVYMREAGTTMAHSHGLCGSEPGGNSQMQPREIPNCRGPPIVETLESQEPHYGREITKNLAKNNHSPMSKIKTLWFCLRTKRPQGLQWFKYDGSKPSGPGIL